jgi:hypothetical protein
VSVAKKSPRSRWAKGASSWAAKLDLETSSSASAIAVGVSTFPNVFDGWLLELQRAVPSAPLDESVHIQLLGCTVRWSLENVNLVNELFTTSTHNFDS